MNDTDNPGRVEAGLDLLTGLTVAAVERFDDDGIITARITFDSGATLYVDDPTLYDDGRGAIKAKLRKVRAGIAQIVDLNPHSHKSLRAYRNLVREEARLVNQVSDLVKSDGDRT